MQASSGEAVAGARMSCHVEIAPMPKGHGESITPDRVTRFVSSSIRPGTGCIDWLSALKYASQSTTAGVSATGGAHWHNTSLARSGCSSSSSWTVNDTRAPRNPALSAALKSKPIHRCGWLSRLNMLIGSIGMSLNFGVLPSHATVRNSVFAFGTVGKLAGVSLVPSARSRTSLMNGFFVVTSSVASAGTMSTSRSVSKLGGGSPLSARAVAPALRTLPTSAAGLSRSSARRVRAARAARSRTPSSLSSSMWFFSGTRFRR